MKLRKPTTDFHLYARYFNTETRCIYEALHGSQKFQLTHHIFRQPFQNNIRNIHSKFVLVENKTCRYNPAREVYIQHGFGINGMFRKKELETRSLRNRIFCVPNEIYRQTLLKIGYSPNEVLNVGYPFSAALLNPIDPIQRRMYLLEQRLDPDKKTVLYAPSWNKQRIKKWFGLSNKLGKTRQLFGLWWEDSQEYSRVEALCHFCHKQGVNLLVRLHEKDRYHQDWLGLYGPIFKTYGVPATYLDEVKDNMSDLLYSDVMISDFSSMMTNFYVMNKPVIHIDVYQPESYFMQVYNEELRETGYLLEDRAGYVIQTFDDMLGAIQSSLQHPEKFADQRQAFCKKYIDYMGKASLDRVVGEFSNLVQRWGDTHA